MQRIHALPDTTREYIIKIIRFRFVIWVFARKDLKLKYNQMFLGLGWLIGQPLISLVIYSVFFGFLLDINDFDYPYYLYVFSGLICWNVFSQVFANVSQSMLSNKDLLAKVSYPKIIFALSKMLFVLIENSVLFVLFSIVLLIVHPQSYQGWIISVLILLLAAISSFSIGLIVAAMSVKKRDFAFISPHLLSFMIWVTPVFYPISIIPQKFQSFLYINPIAAILDLFRWSLGLIPDINHFSIFGLLLTFALLIMSFFVFKKVEFDIAEKI